MANPPERSPSVARPKLTGHAGPNHSNRPTVPFDIDQFISICTGGRLDIYFDAIQRADNAALNGFRKDVIRHKRRPQTRRYMADRTPQGTYRFSPHDDYLLKAIWWEKTKRSRLRLWLYKTTLPIKKAWLFFWRGMELKEHKYLGYVTVGRKPDNGFTPHIGIRMTLSHTARKIRKYVVCHHWQIVFALIGIATIYVMWVSK